MDLLGYEPIKLKEYFRSLRQRCYVTSKKNEKLLSRLIYNLRSGTCLCSSTCCADSQKMARRVATDGCSTELWLGRVIFRRLINNI